MTRLAVALAVGLVIAITALAVWWRFDSDIKRARARGAHGSLLVAHDPWHEVDRHRAAAAVPSEPRIHAEREDRQLARTGSKAEAKRAIELGCYFLSMWDNVRHAAMVAAIPFDRLLTETGGLFTKTAERPSKPVDVAVVVEAVSHLHAMSAMSFATTVRINLRSVLQRNGEGA